MKNKVSCKQRPAGQMKNQRQLRNSPSKALTYLRGFKSNKNRCGNSRDCSFRRDLLKGKKETEHKKRSIRQSGWSFGMPRVLI